MKQEYLLLITGLSGALIGAAASIVTTYIQGRIQARRERLRAVADLAMRDYEGSIDRYLKSGEAISIPPPIVYLHYYTKLLKHIEKGKLTTEQAEELQAENWKLIETVKRIDDDLVAKVAAQAKTDDKPADCFVYFFMGRRVCFRPVADGLIIRDHTFESNISTLDRSIEGRSQEQP